MWLKVLGGIKLRRGAVEAGLWCDDEDCDVDCGVWEVL